MRSAAEEFCVNLFGEDSAHVECEGLSRFYSGSSAGDTSLWSADGVRRFDVFVGYGLLDTAFASGTGYRSARRRPS